MNAALHGTIKLTFDNIYLMTNTIRYKKTEAKTFIMLLLTEWKDCTQIKKMRLRDMAINFI